MYKKINTYLKSLFKWYMTPAGVLSLLFIVAAFIFLAMDRFTEALATVLVWLVFLLPYKFSSISKTFLESKNFVTNRENVLKEKIEMSFAELEDRFLEYENGISRNSLEEIDAFINSKVDQVGADILNLEEELSRYIEDYKQQLETNYDYIKQATQKSNRDVQAISAIYNQLSPEFSLPVIENWTITIDGALAYVNTIKKSKPKLIVELGSGVSTVLAAQAVANNGFGKVISVEHDKRYVAETKRLLKDRGLEEYVELVVCPLKKFEIDSNEYLWYSIDGELFDQKIDLLLVDGPPARTQKHARYPAVPMLYDYLSQNCEVFLDDINRKEEIEILELWKTQYRLYPAVYSRDKTLVKLKLSDNID